MSKFKKPEKNSIYNPVDWFNEFGTFQQIFEGDKKCISFSVMFSAAYNIYTGNHRNINNIK